MVMYEYDAMVICLDPSFDQFDGLINSLFASNVFPHITVVVLIRLLYQHANKAVPPH